MNRRLMAFAGLAWFALLLAAMEFWQKGHVTWLPARTIAVAVITVALASRLRPATWAAKLNPGSLFFPAAMFVLLTSHFLSALGGECLRAFRAWRLATGSPRALKGKWIAATSLGHALAGILKRSIARAERVYAALAVSGVAR